MTGAQLRHLEEHLQEFLEWVSDRDPTLEFEAFGVCLLGVRMMATLTESDEAR